MIKYDSIPVYNYSYVANAISPSIAIFTDTVRKETAWSCENWITFFNELKGKYGEVKAKDIWSNYWLMGLSKSAGGKGDVRTGSGLVYDSVPLDCRSFNSDFGNFITKYKLRDVVYKGLGNITKPIGSVTGIVGDVSDSADTTAKVLKYGVPITVITCLGLLIWYGIKKVKS